MATRKKREKKGKDVMVYMTDEIHEKAKRIGMGNVSKGLRIAITEYKELSPEEEWARALAERDRLLQEENQS